MKVSTPVTYHMLMPRVYNTASKLSPPTHLWTSGMMSLDDYCFWKVTIDCAYPSRAQHFSTPRHHQYSPNAIPRGVKLTPDCITLCLHILSFCKYCCCRASTYELLDEGASGFLLLQSPHGRKWKTEVHVFLYPEEEPPPSTTVACAGRL